MKFEHYYEEAGSGYPLILLHGNSESAEYFRHQIDYFSEEYRVIAVDTRGHGRSPRGDGPFSISRFADDLNDFMERHGIEKAHILGFSDGGNTALVFALRYPQRVNRLILNGANLYFSGMYAAVCLPILLRYVFWSLFKSVSAKAVKNAEMVGLMVHDPALKPEDLREMKIKTLVIAGTRDMVKTSHTRLIFENIPDAQLKLIRGDHFIAYKKWKEFNDAVEEFLKQE